MTNGSQANNGAFPWKGLLLLIALVGLAIFRSHLGTAFDSFTDEAVARGFDVGES